MKNILRNKKTVAVVLLLSVITAFLLFSNSNHIISRKVELSGNYVDNRYNNMICGTTDLLRIRNKIEQTISGTNEYSREIRVFNRITHNDELLFAIDQYDFYSFVVTDHTIVFKAFSSLPNENDQYEYEILSINLDEKRIVPIMSDENINGFNVFQEVVYITTDEGIFSYNLQNNALQCLTQTRAEDCFILDDEWVYFTKKNCSLWRVSQTGGESVKIFG